MFIRKYSEFLVGIGEVDASTHIFMDIDILNILLMSARTIHAIFLSRDIVLFCALFGYRIV